MTDYQWNASTATVISTPEYLILMGGFQTGWASVELVTDFAIWKLLKVTREQAHLITSGMMFGRKARLLADLIGRSDLPNKAAVMTAFNKVRGKNLRDVFAHSYLGASRDGVVFLERKSGGEYKGVEHPFTLKEFEKHVYRVLAESSEFQAAIGVSGEELQAFAQAALSLDRNEETSPDSPTSNM